MYIEETGAGDGDITLTVDGESYTSEANYDSDGDGIDDAVRVMGGDGAVAYVDDNADGHADLMQRLNDDGAVVGQSHFDALSGDWVVESGQQRPAGKSSESLVVDTPLGAQHVGPPTEDTNDDGKPDTAIVQTTEGTMMVTDLDGDGSADQIVELTSNGEVTVSHRVGQGQWTVVERGRMDGSGEYAPQHSQPVGTDDMTWSVDDDLVGVAEPAGVAASADANWL